MKALPGRAFTLIELLVVVAIMAILAAVAVPNFLEAQTRGKVARVASDLRTLMGAIEAYHVDNNVYPHAAIGDFHVPQPLVAITTPIAYLSAIPADPFSPAPINFVPDVVMEGYNYKDAATTAKGMPGETYGWYVWWEDRSRQYLVHSPGPNRVWDVIPFADYDPTNGTISTGDILRLGPMGGGRVTSH